MEDFFYDSLIYICEHDERGAFGLVINQPLKLTRRIIPIAFIVFLNRILESS